MARTVLTVMKPDDYSVPASAGAYASMLAKPDTTDGAEFEMGKDHKTMILLVNDGSSAVTATVKAGNGLQGVSDLTVSLAAGAYTVICPEAGRFKLVSGADHGKVLITGGAKVAVFELP